MCFVCAGWLEHKRHPEVDKALLYYAKAHELGNDEAGFNIGALYDRFNDVEKAIEWLEKTKEWGLESDMITYYLREAYFRLGKKLVLTHPDKALDAFKKAHAYGHEEATSYLVSLAPQ